MCFGTVLKYFLCRSLKMAVTRPTFPKQQCEPAHAARRRLRVDGRQDNSKRGEKDEHEGLAPWRLIQVVPHEPTTLSLSLFLFFFVSTGLDCL